MAGHEYRRKILPPQDDDAPTAETLFWAYVDGVMPPDEQHATMLRQAAAEAREADRLLPTFVESHPDRTVGACTCSRS